MPVRASLLDNNNMADELVTDAPVKCPHDPCDATIALRQLPLHLEQCEAVCRTQAPQHGRPQRALDTAPGSHAAPDPAAAPAHGVTGSTPPATTHPQQQHQHQHQYHQHQVLNDPPPPCSHLERFDQMLTEFFPTLEDHEAGLVACPHDHNQEEPLAVPAHSISSHLQECAPRCAGYSRDTGQCDHQESIDDLVAETLRDEATASCTAAQAAVLARTAFDCPHTGCGKSFPFEELRLHMGQCETTCPVAEKDNCTHKEKLDSFLASFQHRPVNDQDQAQPPDFPSRELKDQPPIFCPPSNASREEVRELRRQHMERIRKLTPSQKRERQILRNRRTAKISRKRKLGREEELMREIAQLRLELEFERKRNAELAAAAAQPANPPVSQTPQFT